MAIEFIAYSLIAMLLIELPIKINIFMELNDIVFFFILVLISGKKNRIHKSEK